MRVLPPRILVINPNSNAAVTAAISAALDPLRTAGGPAIDCVTLSGTPFGIESQADIDAVVEPLKATVEATEADGYVIACYSDPGLDACRAATAKPVFGIHESAVPTALSRGGRFGVIALHDDSIRRHLHYLAARGLDGRLAGERAAHLSVDAAARDETAFAKLLAAGRDLRETADADVIILGCAGMARHRAPLEETLGVPVIEPTQAAVAMALAAVSV